MATGLNPNLPALSKPTPTKPTLSRSPSILDLEATTKKLLTKPGYTSASIEFMETMEDIQEKIEQAREKLDRRTQGTEPALVEYPSETSALGMTGADWRHRLGYLEGYRDQLLAAYAPPETPSKPWYKPADKMLKNTFSKLGKLLTK